MSDIVIHGSVQRSAESQTVRILRNFNCGPGRLWEALTRPDMLVKWLAPGKIELCLGGRAKLDFQDSGIAIDSMVSDIRPPNVIEYSWSSPAEPIRPLRFQSRIVPSGTELTLTLTIPPDEDSARAAAGFEAHLEMLAAALEDVPIAFPFAYFKAARMAYLATA